MFRKRKAETSQQSHQKLYQPIFKKLWDMEFPNLGNINPFLVVIDKTNCAHMGAPDYFDVITRTPVRSDYDDFWFWKLLLVHMQIMLLSFFFLAHLMSTSLLILLMHMNLTYIQQKVKGWSTSLCNLSSLA
jgi:hypothetical protein